MSANTMVMMNKRDYADDDERVDDWQEESKEKKVI